MKTTTATPESPAIKEAAALGAKAFAEGKQRVPALDKNVLPLIGKNNGQAIAILDAWLKGFDRALALEPIPGWSKEENEALPSHKAALAAEEADPIFGEVISSYSRAQAIEDGVLVDVSEVAKEAGFRFPVAVTQAVWAQLVAVPEGVQAQDEQGRLWDIVYMASRAAKGAKGDRFTFQVYVRNNNHARLTRKDLFELVAVCGPGDDLAPVITITLPGED